MESGMMAAALRYARLGLSVIPLRPRQKKPMFDNWPDVATADATVISRWWRQNPEANVGIATGRKSGCFVFDVDPKNGGQESYDGLVSKHGRFPDTWQQITGSGGMHLFFRYPAFCVRNAVGLFPGIDIRGDGGQVVAPPSIHPDTGRTYEWDGLKEIEQTALAEAPVWLLDLLLSRGQNYSEHLPVADKIPHGVQHYTLLALAGAMRRLGLDSSEIEPVLQSVNLNRCEQPGPLENIVKIAKSVQKYRPADHDLWTTACKLWKMTATAERKKAETDKRLGLEVVDGLTIYKTPEADSKCIIEGALFHGLTIFAGPPKVGKSWLVLQAAVAVSHGDLFLGKLNVAAPGRVLYVALEESQSRTSGRLKKLTPENVMLQNVSFVYSMFPLLGGGMEQLERLLESQQPSVVVIDTFLALAGGEQRGKSNVMRSEYQEINALHALAGKYQTAMLLVHHTRKGLGNEGTIDSVAGSRGITAAADCIWGLKREDKDSAVLEVIGRDSEDQQIALKFGKDEGSFGWIITGDAIELKGRKQQEQLMKILENEGPLTPYKAALLLRENANEVRDAMYELYRCGYVMKNASGAYYVSAKAAHDAQEPR